MENIFMLLYATGCFVLGLYIGNSVGKRIVKYLEDRKKNGRD